MNNIDVRYQELLKDILENGVSKMDRTGTGTISVFGRQIRHSMKDGFPLLTTKKMYFKGIVTELIWFLRGNTNIKYLVDNNCHIWDGDAYKFYLEHYVDEYNEELEKKNEGLGWMAQELVNIRPLSKEQFIEKIKTDDEFVKKWGELGPVYGKQWRSWCGYEKVPAGWEHGAITYYKNVAKCDQIETLIRDLKTNPDSRRLMVSAWNVGELDQMTLPPCHYGFQVYTRELSLDERMQLWQNQQDGRGEFVMECLDVIPKRAISLMWNQRSVDTPLGLPFNIASYALLLEIIARSVNMVPDELIGNLGDTHIYQNQIEGVREQITREPYKLPKLEINSGNENWHLLDIDEIINSLDCDLTFKITDYESHPTIKFPLSN